MLAEGTFTNVLNHTNLGDPNMNLRSPDFGQITNTVGTDFGGEPCPLSTTLTSASFRRTCTHRTGSSC